MSETFFLSITIPVFNAEKYLLKCINSILEQTFIFYEIILIDDASTDESLNIIKTINCHI